MADIPLEVMDNVAQHLEGDISSLKNLRLSSKLLSYAAARYLYRKLLVYYFPQSWEKVNLVANYPKLAVWVKVLQLANLENVPYLANLEEWKEYVKQESSLDFISSAGLDVDPEKIDDALAKHYPKFLRWSEWRLFTNGSLKINSTRPDLHLSSLRNLQSIESLGAHNIWPSEQDAAQAKGVRERDTVIALDRHPHYSNDYHLTRFVLSTRSAGFSLTSLKLHVIFQAFPPEAVWPPEYELSELRNLEIDLTGSLGEDSSYYGVWPDCVIAPWLSKLDSLETFKLVEDPQFSMQFDAMSRLHEVNWPKLRHLHLENVDNTGFGNDIVRFIDERVDNLRTLRIIRPMMDLDMWHSCHDSIQDIVTAYQIDFESTPPSKPSTPNNDNWDKTCFETP